MATPTQTDEDATARVRPLVGHRMEALTGSIVALRARLPWGASATPSGATDTPAAQESREAPEASIATGPTTYLPIDRVMRNALDTTAAVVGYKVVTDAPRADADQVFHAVDGPRPAFPADVAWVAEHYARQEHIFVSYFRGEPVGTLSLFQPDHECRTLSSSGCALPAGVTTDDVLDIGRLVIARGHRGGARFTMLCLLAAAQRFSQKAGRIFWIGNTPASLVEVFRGLNPTVRLLAPAPRASSKGDASPAASGDDDVHRYWAAYRDLNHRPLVSFILRPDGGAPSTVLSHHMSQRVRSASASL